MVTVHTDRTDLGYGYGDKTYLGEGVGVCMVAHRVRY